ncbi:MAG: O-antigen ligase family protein [Bacteroidales bacterium]
MSRKLEISFVLLFSLLFIAINSYYAYKQSFTVSLLPFVLLAGAWVVFAPTKLFFTLVLLAPLSVPLRRILPGLPFDFWFPTEPILVLLLVLIVLKSISERYFQRELLSHPVFITMLFYLAWLLIAIVPSEMPIVSIKYFLVRFWFLGVFFYLAFILFRENKKNITRYLWFYIFGLIIVVLYSISKQASVSLFSHRASHLASAPFFIDHTSYGAVLALIVPIAAAFAANAKTLWIKFLTSGLTMFFLFALLLSYSRAAWLSLVIGMGVWVLIKLRIKLRTIVITGAIGIVLLFTFYEVIMWRLERNTTDSSGNLSEHIQSIYNIRSDASNLERINRWDAALDMFMERPLFGWGPGTYQFLYAPFQKNYNKTIISTNFGDFGNAHSEYLGLMSEAGLPAVIAFIAIWVFVLIRGIRLTQREDILKEDRNIVLACIVGLVTYISHAFLNNFLDADKVAALYWGYMAVIVAFDVKYGNKKIVNVHL